MSQFNKNIKEGLYDVVSPGEFCSLELAKDLGIYDSQNYFNPEYKDLKTFKSDKDSSDERQAEICSVTANGNTAYKFCSIEHGIGFTRKPAHPDKCITVGCPTDFKSSGTKCEKPLEDYAVSTRSRCDERWYDWFMIPNYHLGNKYYSSKVGECYKPCPVYSVPQYAKDPVDDSSAGFNATEKMDKCVPRTSYMNGKYMMGSDYCPLAWVYRLAATPTMLTQEINTKLDALKEEKKNVNDKYEALRTNANSEALQIAKEAGSVLENIEQPDDVMNTACQSLATDERVQFAYDVCERLAEDDIWYGQQLADELEDNDAVQQAKTRMLKQACNALFCSGTAYDQVGKGEICIQSVLPVEPIEDDTKPLNPPSSDNARKFIFSSASFGMKAIFLSVFGVLLYLFIVNYLYPFLKKVYIKIKDLFLNIKKDGSKQAQVVDTQNK